MKSIKVKSNIKSLLTKISKIFPKKYRTKFDSSVYWENRYKTGGNSGPGSYYNLANFKANIINNFVHSNNILKIIEFGSGDGNQLLLANYPNYIGLDISEIAIKLCKDKFKLDKSKTFSHYSSKNEFDPKNIYQGDLSLSLDVLFHLTEDHVFAKYMRDLFSSATKYVIIYSSNFEEQIIHHVRHRKFTSWVTINMPEWELFNTIKNDFPFDSERPETTSYSDFYFYRKIQKN